MELGGWLSMIGIKTSINSIFVKYFQQIEVNFQSNLVGLVKRNTNNSIFYCFSNLQIIYLKNNLI